MAGGAARARCGAHAGGIAAIVAASLALSGAPALASTPPHVFSGSFGSAGSGDAQFSNPQGVAVDQATGDVYVADTGNHRIEKFDAHGNFVLAFGANVGGSGVNTCTSGCGAGTSGTAADQFTAPTFLAVDSSGGASQGDVYVADTGDNLVTKFDSSGNLVSSWGSGGQLNGSTATGGPFGSLAGITVDTAGNLWVYDQNGNMFEFAQSGGFSSHWNSNRGVTPGGIAVDASGNLYVATGAVGVTQFTSSGTQVGDIDDSYSNITGIAVDPSTTDLYVDDGSLIHHYGSSCNPAAGCTPTDSFGSGNLTGGAGVAVDSATSTVYVADSGANQIAVFAPPPPGPPTIDGESATGASGSAVKLDAQINPHGLDTTYHFEYGPTTSYGASVPIPDADIGSAQADQAVSQQLSGLAPSTSYHYRVVAMNSQGTAHGPDQVLATNPGVAPVAANSTNCPNAQFRTGPSAKLPDCRAYEQVTPVDKQGAQDMFVTGSTVDPVAVTDGGSKVLLETAAALGPSPDAVSPFYVFDRSPSGWGMTSLAPSGTGSAGQQAQIISSDLSDVGVRTGTSTFTTQSPAAAVQFGSPGGPYTTIANTPAGSETDGYSGATSDLMGASSDFGHVVFQSLDHSLAPDASAQVDHNHAVYEWVAGQLRLVNVNTDGSLTSPCGAIVGNGVPTGFAHNAVSSDGSKIFFVSPDPAAVSDDSATDPSCWNPGNPTVNPPQLYMRVDGGKTVDISCPPTVPHPSGCQPAGFVGAASDGSKVFFMTASELNFSREPLNGELYAYDTNTGALTRVSSGTSGTAAGNVAWGFPSDDGSTVYFGAFGKLTPDAPALSLSGSRVNLYRYDTASATTTYIATVSQDDYHQTAAFSTAFFDFGYQNSANWYATPNGRFLVFSSTADVTGYDPNPAGTQHRELYRYDGADGSLRCVSCSPDGSAPASDANFEDNPPPGSSTGTTRPISNDGSYILFDSSERLVPQDTNNVRDVYEWHNGQLSLISSGSGSVNSISLGTSADGTNAFFGTHDQLAPSDTDQNGDLYDAHIGGGYPPPSSAPACSGDGCQGALSAPPSLPTAASVTFSGPGNANPASAPSATPKPRVLTRTVHGAKFLLAVSVPGAGRITITGAGIHPVRRSVASAGTYRWKVTLTPKLRRALRHKHKLRLGLRVGYAPAGGQASSVRVELTVKA